MMKERGFLVVSQPAKIKLVNWAIIFRSHYAKRKGNTSGKADTCTASQIRWRKVQMKLPNA
jgi:hypothetical protein